MGYFLSGEVNKIEVSYFDATPPTPCESFNTDSGFCWIIKRSHWGFRLRPERCFTSSRFLDERLNWTCWVNIFGKRTVAMQDDSLSLTSIFAEQAAVPYSGSLHSVQNKTQLDIFCYSPHDPSEQYNNKKVWEEFWIGSWHYAISVNYWKKQLLFYARALEFRLMSTIEVHQSFIIVVAINYELLLSVVSATFPKTIILTKQHSYFCRLTTFSGCRYFGLGRYSAWYEDIFSSTLYGCLNDIYWT